MKKYIIPGTMEMIKCSPEISVCDQQQYVQDNRDTTNMYPARFVIPNPTSLV